MRQTFIEEAPVVSKPERQAELFSKWHIPFAEFLYFALSHELGHAFCHESDEIKAERAGQRLRAGEASVCSTRHEEGSYITRTGPHFSQ